MYIYIVLDMCTTHVMSLIVIVFIGFFSSYTLVLYTLPQDSHAKYDITRRLSTILGQLQRWILLEGSSGMSVIV